MQAIYFDGSLSLKQVPRPRINEGEALIRIIYAGICNTDLEIIKGYMGFKGIPGHEFVGEVVECPSEPGLLKKRVVGEINISSCRGSVARRHDPHREVLGIAGHQGCFAQFLAMPVNNLLIIPDEISSKAATFVEPVAAALEILEQKHIQPNDKIAVLGDGKLGMLCGQVLTLQGNSVTLMGKHQSKLDLASSLGLNAVHKDNTGDLASQFDLVVECSGGSDGLSTAMNLVKPRGTIVLKTTRATPPALDTNRLVIDEITLLGSRCGPFPPAIELLAAGRVKVEPLIQGVYPLAQSLEALEHAGQAGTLKILLENS